MQFVRQFDGKLYKEVLHARSRPSYGPAYLPARQFTSTVLIALDELPLNCAELRRIQPIKKLKVLGDRKTRYVDCNG